MSRDDCIKIHQASLHILHELGVAFHGEVAIELFKRHGFRTEGKVVFFDEKKVQSALDTAPSHFTLHARNADNTVEIGMGQPVFAPGYGSPFVMEPGGVRRRATMDDYRKFCMLTQSSSLLNCLGFLLVDPDGHPPNTYHLPMLEAGLTLSDKPIMGAPLSQKAVKDSIALAQIVFGKLDEAVMISNINSLAPLQFAAEMSDAMVEFATNAQAVIITGGGILGSNAPMKVAGLMAIQNAAILAGLVLTQLARPGAPVVMGFSGSPLDMRIGAYYIASAEYAQGIELGIELAHYYGLPVRAGGCINDAHMLDFQAGAQSVLTMSSAMQDGVDFVLHACGSLGTYMAMSYEKFLADEELCSIIAKSQTPPLVDESSIDLDTIMEVGVGGNYLQHPKTFELCRTEFLPTVFLNRAPYKSWQIQQPKQLEQKLTKLVQQRLEDYQKPTLDRVIQKAINEYIVRNA